MPQRTGIVNRQGHSSGTLTAEIELCGLPLAGFWERARLLRPYLGLMIAASVRYQVVLVELRRRSVVRS